MPNAVLDTSSPTYASDPPRARDDRFDSGAEQILPWREAPALQGALTGALMLLAVTAIEPTTAQGADWSSGVVVARPASISDRNAVLSSQISMYRDLPMDWDGEEGHPPTDKAVNEALSFINFLPLGAPLPKTSVSGDGEVGFYWRTINNDGFIDVSFYGDGNIYYYARIESVGIDIGRAEAYTGRSIPKELAETIAKI